MLQLTCLSLYRRGSRYVKQLRRRAKKQLSRLNLRQFFLSYTGVRRTYTPLIIVVVFEEYFCVRKRTFLIYHIYPWQRTTNLIIIYAEVEIGIKRGKQENQ